jgi:hypothetical protein
MTASELHSEDRTKGQKLWLPCERCANSTQHLVHGSIDVEDVNEVADIRVWQSFQIVECLGCRWLSFRHEWSSSDDTEASPSTGDERPVLHEVLYPARLPGQKPLDDQHLPAKVRGIYEEAHFALRNEQRILAAIGIRALVEAVCAEKSATGRDLNQQIDDLVVRGVLTPDGAKVLHGTRLLGNKAAHEVQPPVREKLVAAFQVAENLLQNVFILPKIAARLPKKRVP